MRRFADIAFIVCFAIICVGFGVCTFASRETVSVNEKRNLVAMPKLRGKTLAAFPTQFEEYFSDHLFARNDLVKARNYAKYVAWQKSGNDRVLAGKNGWLYLGWDGAVEIGRNEKLFTQEQLQNWGKVLQQRTKWCADRGITYVFVVAPDKPSIYPEFVPNVLKPVQQTSRLDQLSAYLRTVPGITFINLKDPLLSHKKESELYLKTDTHWNDKGAYIGYCSMMQGLSRAYPSTQNLSIAAANFVQTEYRDGDLARMMGLRNRVYESVPMLAQLTGHETAKPFPKAIIFHDSFADRLKPYLEKHFPDMMWVRQGNTTCDAYLIEQTKPKIVIQECIERHVVAFDPTFVENWGGWLKSSLGTRPAKEYLMVLPNTHDISVPRLEKYLDGNNVSVSSVRQWTDNGEKVAFDQKTAGYADWYLLKTGDQGFKLANQNSEREYEKLQSYIRDGKHYKLSSELALENGEKLQLYKRL